MGAESIQNKLNQAYRIVAKQLGTPFEVYRPFALGNPIDSDNYIDEQLVAFSKDNKYATPPSGGLSLWRTWIDGRLNNLFDLENGDILFNPSTLDTYIMVGLDLHQTHQAIKAEHRVSFQRVTEAGYGDADGTGFAPGNVSTTTVYATDVPCQVIQQGAFGTQSYIPASTSTEDTIARYEIYLWDNSDTIEERDIIIYGTLQIQVQSISKTDIGLRVSARALPK